MQAHRTTIILALLFVFGLLAVDSVVARNTNPTAAPLINVETGYRQI